MSTHSQAKKRTPFWVELPFLVVIALAIAVIIKTFLVQTFFIPSGSMEHTLEIGDRVMVNKLAYDRGSPIEATSWYSCLLGATRRSPNRSSAP